MRTLAVLKNSILALTLGASLVGCGQQTFDVLQSQHQTDAPGGIDIPARVDILLVLDNTGSMIGKESFVGTQIRNQFIAKLDEQKWDYRIAIVPTTPNGVPALTQMAVSKYSFGHPAYTPPYPNADVNNDPWLAPDWSIARTSSTFNANAPSANQGGSEPTLITIGDVLNDSNWKSKFLRPTAKLVVIVVSNGDDTSEPAQGNVFPYIPPSTVHQNLINRIKSVRPNAKLHSVVNMHSYQGVSCLGGTFRPDRYLNASSQLSGRPYALCTPSGQFDTSFGTVLSSLATELQPMRHEYEQEFAVIAYQPIESSIVVRKRLANGSVQTIPNSSVNGWTYVGAGSTYEVTTPIFDRYKTGYVIKLHGTARAIGSETISVSYQEYGTGKSH